MAIVKTTVKGQVVIPAKLRKKYNIVKGVRVNIVDGDGQIIIKPLLTDPIKEARGFLKGKTSILKALLKDREEEAKR